MAFSPPGGDAVKNGSKKILLHSSMYMYMYVKEPLSFLFVLLIRS